MSVRGIFTSHSGIIGDRVNDFSSKVLQIGWAGTAPLLALSAGMPSEPVKNTTWSWIEDSHISGNTEVAATEANVAATTFTVLDTQLYVRNQVIENQNTGEQLLITGISGTTLTVRRGLAGTTPAAMTEGDPIQSIGTAFPEGGGKPDPIAQRGDEYTNYCQIFKNGWSITGTAMAVKWHSGSQLALNKEQCAAYHAEDQERSFWFSRKAVTTLDNKQLRLSNGIVAQLEGYGGQIESAETGGNAGELSMRDLQVWLSHIFDVNLKGFPNERIAFTGSATMQIIQDMVLQDTTYNIEVNESEYGIAVWSIKGFNHKIKFMTHPLFSENAVWAHSLYVLHPGTIKKRTLRPSWSQEFTAGRQNNNGVDADEGFLAIEQGWELKAAKASGIMRNIQEGVKSFA